MTFTNLAQSTDTNTECNTNTQSQLRVSHTISRVVMYFYAPSVGIVLVSGRTEHRTVTACLTILTI